MLAFTAGPAASEDNRVVVAPSGNAPIRSSRIAPQNPAAPIPDTQIRLATQSAQPKPGGKELELWLDALAAALPEVAADYGQNDQQAKLRKAASASEQWAAELVRMASGNSASPMPTVNRLLAAKQRVDNLLEDLLSARQEFTSIDDAIARRTALRGFLDASAALIDLSGRLRFILSDLLNMAAYRFASQPAEREKLIDLLIERRSTIGASVMSLALFDPPANSPNRAQPASPAVKQKLLKLIAVSGQNDLLSTLAEFARHKATPPALVIEAAETIRAVGLPQDPRPGQDATLPKAPITARQLRDALVPIVASQLRGDLTRRRETLLSWLNGRIKQGLETDSYQLGKFEVRSGDWLLMRNPSPYNQFTDLSPGLFTHVGVVSLETGSDGIKRMVLVDLPERGTKMPATNVEVFVQRSLHYAFLRHPDAEAARTMGATAAATIGNPTEFDLNFRTNRVAELRGKPLPGVKIRTYCAGLLLLCAQETGLPREEFFPLKEGVAGGRTAENLAKLGMSIGEDFISPTGALFSTKLQLVGRREPMYEPRREIEEAIFDSFAFGLEWKELRVAPDMYQSLRLKLAEASKQNPLLAKAMAEAAGVSAELDLVAAAKAAAVVESLDDVAYGNSGDFQTALGAMIYRGPIEALSAEGLRPDEIERIKQARRRHADLLARIEKERLTSRQIRQILVKYYSDRGKSQIDARFFGS